MQTEKTSYSFHMYPQYNPKLIDQLVVCPDCGQEVYHLQEGVCSDCCEENQKELDEFNAEYDW